MRKLRCFMKNFGIRNGFSIRRIIFWMKRSPLLFRHLPFETAKEGMNRIEGGIGENYLILEWTTKERFNKAMELRLTFRDKPRIPFTDLTSMVVMKELRIKDVLTEDDHFTQVGMGFRKVP